MRLPHLDLLDPIARQVCRVPRTASRNTSASTSANHVAVAVSRIPVQRCSSNQSLVPRHNNTPPTWSQRARCAAFHGQVRAVSGSATMYSAVAGTGAGYRLNFQRYAAGGFDFGALGCTCVGAATQGGCNRVTTAVCVYIVVFLRLVPEVPPLLSAKTVAHPRARAHTLRVHVSQPSFEHAHMRVL